MTPAARFPAAAGLTWTEVGGGLSGARVWRGDDAGGLPRAALKELPAGFPADRLRQVHGWMRAARLAVVPAVFDAGGDTVAEVDGHVWECVGWVPGDPVLVDELLRKPTYDLRWNPRDHHPPQAPLVVACETLAAVHRAWAPPAPVFAPPPGIARRRALFADVQPLLRRPADPRGVLADLRHRIPIALAALDRFDRPGPVHPCICDPRPEHFLFAGDRLTGVIDYAAMKLDHPAVDLARLLMETDFVSEGVAAYHAAGGNPAVTPELVDLLAYTGRVGATANWLLRLRDREPTPAEADRLERLLGGMVH